MWSKFHNINKIVQQNWNIFSLSFYFVSILIDYLDAGAVTKWLIKKRRITISPLNPKILPLKSNDFVSKY